MKLLFSDLNTSDPESRFPLNVKILEAGSTAHVALDVGPAFLHKPPVVASGSVGSTA